MIIDRFLVNPGQHVHALPSSSLISECPASDYFGIATYAALVLQHVQPDLRVGLFITTGESLYPSEGIKILVSRHPEVISD